MDRRDFLGLRRGWPEPRLHRHGGARAAVWTELGARPETVAARELTSRIQPRTAAAVWAWIGSLPRDLPLDRFVGSLVESVRPGGWVGVAWDPRGRWDVGGLCERDVENRLGNIADALLLNGIRDLEPADASGNALTGRLYARSGARVSVAVLAHNQERYLESGLESLCLQTHPDVEIVAVDDGSTDGTRRVLKRFEDRIWVLSHERRGVAASLNEVFPLLTGRYFTWIGGDNLLYPTALDVLATHLDTFDVLGGVYADHDVLQDDGAFLRVERKPDFSLEKALHGYLMGIVFLLRMEAVRAAGGFDESLEVAEDDAFWLRVAELYPVARVPQVLGGYRFHWHHLTAEARKRRAERLAEARLVSRRIRSSLSTETAGLAASGRR